MAAITFEQQSLLNQINARIAEIQDAVKRALPGNKALHDEFKVGEGAPKTAAESIALGKYLEPVAREYKTLLVGRGVDGAKLTHLATMIATLEKLGVPKAEEAAPKAEAAAPAEADEGGAKKSKKKKA